MMLQQKENKTQTGTKEETNSIRKWRIEEGEIKEVRMREGKSTEKNIKAVKRS